MAGDHACPVCAARFTRPQHVTRHMRSHTGDRPYKCTQCGDQFARSDLLSRHVNKCHSGLPPPVRGKKANQAAQQQQQHLQQQQQQQHQNNPASVTNLPLNLPHAATDLPCDQCLQLRYQCDLGAPCGKCLLRKAKCTYVAKGNKLPGISPSSTGRRPSLPSMLQQQQRDFLFGPHGPASASFPYTTQPTSTNGTLSRSSFDSDNGYPNYTNPTTFGSGTSTVPSYVYDDPRLQFGRSNGVGGSQNLPGLGSLPQSLSRLGAQQNYGNADVGRQPYMFGDSAANGSPLPNTLPALSIGDGGYASEGSPDLKALSSYQQFRRNSLQLPTKGYASDYHFAAPQHSALDHQQFHYPSAAGQSSQQQQQHNANEGLNFSYNSHPTNSALFNPNNNTANGVGLGASSLSANRQFDGARVNERLMAHSSPNHNASNLSAHPTRGAIGGYMFDDASSVSDFGGSNNSGHPSPVPSSHSLSGVSVSSRPTSSPGSSLIESGVIPIPGGGGRYHAGGGHSNGSGSESFVSSLQGAIPLPTPLQMQSFNDGAAGAGAGGAAGGGGGGYHPPYQSFDNMKLEEASFAAAAKNAQGGGPMAGSGAGSGSGGGGGHAGGPMYNGMSVLSAGGKERAINELKDFWSAFISEPLTGGTPGANNGHMLMKQTSMPSLKTPMPLSSERSSILGAGFGSEMANGGGAAGSPTPKALYPNGGASSMLGMTFGSSNLNPNASRRGSERQMQAPEPKVEQQQASAQQPTGVQRQQQPTQQPTQQQQQQQQGQQQEQPPQQRITTTAEDEEALRSYQEACLKRETPMLRLMARPKSRAPSGSAATSPQTKPSTVGGPNVGGDVDMTGSPQQGATNTLRGVGTLGSFAAPFAPDSKKGRDWSSQFQRGPSGGNGNGNGSGGTTMHGRSFSLMDPPTSTAAAAPQQRPNYKRLPSQTLGPETSKKQAMTSSYDDSAVADDDDDGGADNDGGNYDMRYRTSLPQPGYGVNSASGGANGGAHGAWMRQRSQSSPSSLRTFDWQSIAGNTGVGR